MVDILSDFSYFFRLKRRKEKPINFAAIPKEIQLEVVKKMPLSSIRKLLSANKSIEPFFRSFKLKVPLTLVYLQRRCPKTSNCSQVVHVLNEQDTGNLLNYYHKCAFNMSKFRNLIEENGRKMVRSKDKNIMEFETIILASTHYKSNTENNESAEKKGFIKLSKFVKGIRRRCRNLVSENLTSKQMDLILSSINFQFFSTSDKVSTACLQKSYFKGKSVRLELSFHDTDWVFENIPDTLKRVNISFIILPEMQNKLLKFLQNISKTDSYRNLEEISFSFEHVIAVDDILFDLFDQFIIFNSPIYAIPIYYLIKTNSRYIIIIREQYRNVFYVHFVLKEDKMRLVQLFQWELFGPNGLLDLFKVQEVANAVEYRLGLCPEIVKQVRLDLKNMSRYSKFLEYKVI